MGNTQYVCAHYHFVLTFLIKYSILNFSERKILLTKAKGAKKMNEKNERLKKIKGIKMSSYLKFGVIVLMIFSVVLSGCLQQDKATISPTTTPQGASTPSAVLESSGSNPYVAQSDVKGLTLKMNGYTAAAESANYNISTRSTMKQYTDTLPLGMRNVGQLSAWRDDSGKTISVSVDKFDSTDGFQQYFAGMVKSCDRQLKTEEWKTRGDTVEYGCGQANIGDQSYYAYSVAKNTPDVKQVLVYYSKGNYFVSVNIVDLKKLSYNEAIELAGKISGRLN
jgi:hypothetical protein